ncbi:MAG: MraY family glycosyltransferase [Candidatus Altimarinota bacterium]
MSLGLTSFALTFVLLMGGYGVFKKVHWLDKPYLFGYTRAAVPYGLGIVFFLNFLLLALLYLPLDSKLIALLVSGGILTATCFLDDRIKLPAVPRLMIQLLCASIIVFAGVSVPAISNPFGDPFVLDAVRWEFLGMTIMPIAQIIAVLWIVFVVNAMNWLDGAPGIVSGMSTIACMVIYFLATMSDLHVIDQSTLSNMALIIGTSSFAFLFFDFPVPKVLMGDSGTMFLGLMIAVMAIFSGGKFATAFIVLAIPILDAAWTIVRRMLKGQSPFKGDFQHFHHELLRAGLSERQVNLFYYAVSLSFGYAALYLQSFGKLIAILLLFALMVVIRIGLIKKKSGRT